MGIIQSVSLILFVVIGLGISLLPTFFSLDDTQSYKEEQEVDDPVLHESFFHNMEYYSQQNGKDKLRLNASDLTINNQRPETLFFSPKGHAFSSSGMKVNYLAQKGRLNPQTNDLELFGGVELKTEDSLVKAEIVNFYGQSDYIKCRKNVFSQTHSKTNGDIIKVNSKELDIWMDKNASDYRGDVMGVIERKRAYEQDVHFSSDKMRLRMDENKVYLDDNVSVKKRAVVATSRSGEIFLENYNKKLKYFVLYDDVRVVEKVIPGQGSVLAKPFERKAFSEKLEGIMSEGKIILSGYPKVLQQGDVIKGNYIILREDVDVIEVVDANTNFKVGN